MREWKKREDTAIANENHRLPPLTAWKPLRIHMIKVMIQYVNTLASARLPLEKKWAPVLFYPTCVILGDSCQSLIQAPSIQSQSSAQQCEELYFRFNCHFKTPIRIQRSDKYGSGPCLQLNINEKAVHSFTDEW